MPAIAAQLASVLLGLTKSGSGDFASLLEKHENDIKKVISEDHSNDADLANSSMKIAIKTVRSIRKVCLY